MPLAFAASTIMRSFFKLLFGTIVFSLFVGLMFLPVVFSIIGPPALDVAQPPSAATGLQHTYADEEIGMVVPSNKEGATDPSNEEDVHGRGP